MKKTTLYITLTISVLCFFIFSEVNAQNKKTVTFPSSDGISITADVYLSKKTTAPFIVLFHKARSSRGEYAKTALKFNELGYNCIAPDLRSGGTSNGVENTANKQAVSKGLSVEYVDALPDMKATIKYVFDNYKDNDVILLGSSYTASLVLFLATEKNNIIAVMSFSPGEYFRINNKTFADMAEDVRCPVFLTSARKEVKMWLPIYNNIPDVFAFKFEPKNVDGAHGSKTLWQSANGYEEYWNAVADFLDNL